MRRRRLLVTPHSPAPRSPLPHKSSHPPARKQPVPPARSSVVDSPSPTFKEALRKFQNVYTKKQRDAKIYDYQLRHLDTRLHLKPLTPKQKSNARVDGESSEWIAEYQPEIQAIISKHVKFRDFPGGDFAGMVLTEDVKNLALREIIDWFKEGSATHWLHYIHPSPRGVPQEILDSKIWQILDGWQEDTLRRIYDFIDIYVPADLQDMALIPFEKVKNKEIAGERPNEVGIPHEFEYWRILDPEEFTSFAYEIGDPTSEAYKRRRKMNMEELERENDERLYQRNLLIKENIKRMQTEENFGVLAGVRPHRHKLKVDPDQTVSEYIKEADAYKDLNRFLGKDNAAYWGRWGQETEAEMKHANNVVIGKKVYKREEAGQTNDGGGNLRKEKKKKRCYGRFCGWS